MAIDIIKRFRSKYAKQPWFVSSSVVLDPKNGRHIRLIYNKDHLGDATLPESFEDTPVIATHRAIYKAR